MANQEAITLTLMRTFLISIIVAALTIGPVKAQTPVTSTYAAKAGETIDLGPIYWVNAQTCQSLATAKSDVEMLEGPPGLTFEIKEDMVVPVAQGCKNKIKGGRLLMTVPSDIEAASAHVVVRLIHHDRSGEQKRGFAFNLLIAH
jgi:hypothetical protein